jgi:anthranilate phosphoribosyltransferase
MFAGVLARLNTERALIVHGLDGMDEISVTKETKVAEIRDGGIEQYFIKPGDFGIDEYEPDDLKGGDAEENARILRRVLAGEENGAKRAAVLVNAGAAFYVAGLSRSMREGKEYAEEVINSGKALKKLEELVEAGRVTRAA